MQHFQLDICKTNTLICPQPEKVASRLLRSSGFESRRGKCTGWTASENSMSRLVITRPMLLLNSDQSGWKTRRSTSYWTPSFWFKLPATIRISSVLADNAEGWSQDVTFANDCTTTGNTRIHTSVEKAYVMWELARHGFFSAENTILYIGQCTDDE